MQRAAGNPPPQPHRVCTSLTPRTPQIDSISAEQLCLQEIAKLSRSPTTAQRWRDRAARVTFQKVTSHFPHHQEEPGWCREPSCAGDP